MSSAFQVIVRHNTYLTRSPEYTYRTGTGAPAPHYYTKQHVSDRVHLHRTYHTKRVELGAPAPYVLHHTTRVGPGPPALYVSQHTTRVGPGALAPYVPHHKTCRTRCACTVRTTPHVSDQVRLHRTYHTTPHHVSDRCTCIVQLKTTRLGRSFCRAKCAVHFCASIGSVCVCVCERACQGSRRDQEEGGGAGPSS